MHNHKLADFNRGWVVGDFLPSLIKTNKFEVGIKHFKSGEVEKKHFHKLTTEITVVISGVVEMNGKRYCDGDIIVLPANESSDFKCVEDAVTCAIRDGSFPDDKFEIDA